MYDTEHCSQAQNSKLKLAALWCDEYSMHESRGRGGWGGLLLGILSDPLNGVRE